jgi:hypothetical protein
MTRLPQWVLNTLRARYDYDSILPEHIQVNSHDYKDGYETVILWITNGRTMQISRVTGSKYADRAFMCCCECARTTSQLAKVDIHNQHLRTCAAVSCRKLLCVHCRTPHESVHELAGEILVNPWSRVEMAALKIREAKK